MKRSLFFILALIISNLAFCEESVVAISTKDSLKLEGSMLIPKQDKGNVVALFICGSGPTDRDGNNSIMKNNSIKFLAQALDSAGIASLRYDKRGIGKSASRKIDESQIRFTTFVDDADAWVDYLSAKYKKIIIIGHSEGALLGVLEAINNPKVQGVVLVAGIGRSMDEVLKSQISAQSPIIRDMALPIIDSLKCGKQVKNVPPILNSVFRGSVQPFLIESFSFDPAKEIAKLTVPVLIIQGDTDIQVSVEDANILASAQPKAEKHIIHNMNHILKLCPSTDRMKNLSTYNTPTLPNIPEISPLIVNYINKIAMHD